MIRVLQVLGGLKRAGAETMVMNLYRSIDRSQIQFDFVVHTDVFSSEYGAYREEIEKMGGKIYMFPQIKIKNFFQLIKAWNHFLNEHKEYKVLHSHIRSYASIYLPIAHKKGLKTIVHSHSTSNGSGLNSVIKKISQFPLRFQSDYYFGCSKEASEWLFGRRIVNGPKYYMVQNAIDVKKYKFNSQTRDKLRNELGIGTNEIALSHVGRLHEAKNHFFLLKVFFELNNLHPYFKLFIIGDGALKDDIKKQIQEYRLEKKVIMLGNRNDIPDLLQAMDVFVFPSKWEGLPVTVVEAQAAGLPCFISDTITKDVAISKLVTYLPINTGVSPWVDSLSSFVPARLDVSKEIKQSGFDITNTATWISNFYKGLYDE